ncbi:MAG: quinolinate synthase NadA [Pirellulaceae bacterium]|nr:quinolinate synthase NadA [Pirellulaceae bacterium]
MTADALPPNDYAFLDSVELACRIAERKRQLGSRLCVLGHHYQRDEVLEHADFVGDSLKLSQTAAQQEEAEYIVFCGVHFMAESAAILARSGQKVILPNPRAGCPMAAMARASDVRAAIGEIGELINARVLPVTYVNSDASVKGVTGDLGGACCTSANAADVFRWALDPSGGGAAKILMIPDEHLGRNTAVALGYGEEDCAVYDPALPNGGLAKNDVERAAFVLWKGHCYVHQRFTTEHVRAARAADPAVVVMVHPECPREVVAAADRAGSTEQIIRAVGESRPGTCWAIGTESHLVGRLAKQYRDRRIACLSSARPVCVQMGQIDRPHLLWVLDSLAAGRAVNVLTVSSHVVAGASLALRRMMEHVALRPD